MDAETARKLERLRNYGTRYEVTGTNGERTILAGYTARKSQRGLLSMIRKNAEAWVKLSGSAEIEFTGKGLAPMILGGWTLQFSGRTQRESILSGEHPFIGDEENG